jgi:hypothetical protein
MCETKQPCSEATTLKSAEEGWEKRQKQSGLQLSRLEFEPGTSLYEAES